MTQHYAPPLRNGSIVRVSGACIRRHLVSSSNDLPQVLRLARQVGVVTAGPGPVYVDVRWYEGNHPATKSTLMHVDDVEAIS